MKKHRYHSTVSPEDVARLLKLEMEARELSARLDDISREREAILTKGCTECVPDFSMFKDTTRRLLTELWDAPERMLSHEDIRQDVILDEYASDGAVKHVIMRARKELMNHEFAYNIRSIWGKGYQIVARTMPSKKIGCSPAIGKSRMLRPHVGELTSCPPTRRLRVR